MGSGCYTEDKIESINNVIEINLSKIDVDYLIN